MSDKTYEQPGIEQLLAQLSESAGHIDKDDLSALAKMHGWCEALIVAAGAGDSDACAPLSDQAKSLTLVLEGIILNEADDLDASVAKLVEGVAELTALAGGTTPACPLEPDRQVEDDADVDAKLACIFDDDPAGTDTPADDLAASDPANENTTGGDTPADCAAPPPAKATDSEPAYEPVPLFIDSNELEFVKAFVDESGEHLDSIEGAVLEVERAGDDTAKIDDLFRPFHTIKGIAGFMNLRDINCLTHEVETLLDQARKGKRKITSGLIDVVFDVVDILKLQIAAVAEYLTDPDGSEVTQPDVVGSIGLLRDLVAMRVEPENISIAAASRGQEANVEAIEPTPTPAATGQADGNPNTKAPPKNTTSATPAAIDGADESGVAIKTPPKKPAASTGPTVVVDQTVRIDTGKLDALVDMVGELVIAQTQVASSPLVAEHANLNKNVSQVVKIVRDVQEVAMGLRMIPIGGTFQKMARLVRDVSRKANKRVELVVSGEDTELDKNVIQQINDPLVHMIRNAVDHGVETPDVRKAAGKDETGNVYLSAFHHGGNIVIEIRDDGAGLDRDVLFAKGVEKGVVEPDQEMTDSEVYALIFAPGFSTAKTVTDISGRGVGMDVVRRNIEQLRGKVEISSELGKGSTFTIRLPLTLAIIDGMIVCVGTQRFIIPTISIQQALRPTREQITTVQQRGEVLNLRGRLIPLVQLGALFGLTGRTDACEAMVVITQSDGKDIGIIVDDLLGQQQVVIKSLGERFEKLRGISGAAILGDGRVGLILEPSGLAAVNDETRLGHIWAQTAHDVDSNPLRDETNEQGRVEQTAAATLALV